MCLLTFLPPGVQPDTDALRNGTVLNDDGHGFAIVGGDQLIVRHSLHGDDLIDEFRHTRAVHPDGPALFHSRWSTGGTRGLANCHPVAVGGDPRTVIAHNGVLPAEVQPAGADWRSDTRIAAEDFIPRLGRLRLRRTRKRIERWMGAANKIVILTIDRRFTARAYLLNESAGIWDGGIWYSADDFRLHRRQWRPPPADLSGWPVSSCADCGAVVDAAEDCCPWCGTCFDCDQPAGCCLCHPPAITSRWSARR
jgi:hypothetical protein